MSNSGRLGLVVVVLALYAGVVAATGNAKSLLTATVTSPSLADRTCLTEAAASGPGVVTRTVEARRGGWIAARLRAASGNWDLAVIDTKTGRMVAGSADYGARELAEGVLDNPTTLRVQACRLSGHATTARVSLEILKLPKTPLVDLVRVATPTREARAALAALGFDWKTDHAGPVYTDVYIPRTSDASKIGQTGLLSVTLVPDAARAERAARRAERLAARLAPDVTGLPSGRTGPYRRLPDYTSEMNALATANPNLVKRITLSPSSYEGRPLEGVEVTENVNERDGKPVFLMVGEHHAREWPSSEHTIEWAYELVTGYNGTGTYTAPSLRVVNLMKTVRTIIVPIVNPDGFNASREFGEIYGNGNGDDSGLDLAELNEYRRKNCRVNEAPTPVGNCAGPAFGVGSTGVDLNRNYGTFWGGPGSSTDTTSEIYHGPHCAGDTPVKGAGCGPFSEPETEAVRRLVSARQVTTLITNHTFAELVLRAPGLKSQGLAPDELAMKDLGDRMACENGYASQYGWQLYDTTGTTEDWSYNVTGGYGYTFEIGSDGGDFHTSFPVHVNEQYEGTSLGALAADPCRPNRRGLGNREAYFIAMENTADATQHSVIRGQAPAGAVLRLHKVFQTPTSITNPDLSPKTFTDTLDSTTVVPPSGQFEWHINPSTSPLSQRDRGRPSHGTPSAPVTFSGDATSTTPGGCGDDNTQNPNCFDDFPFTVPGGIGVDNYQASIQLTWPTPASDWDIRVYRDANNNGKSDASDPLLAKSEQGTTSAEATTVAEPDLTPGNYVVRVINYQAFEPYNGTITFYGPIPFVPAHQEAYTLTCEQPEGTVKSTSQLFIDRGDQKTLTGLCGNPTAVEVEGFSARPHGGSVALSWRTGSEHAIAAFNVWRGQKKLNGQPIAAKHTAGGSSYGLLDRKVKAGRSYTYRLQIVRLNGQRAWAASSTVKVAIG
jgi:hypothetical protein